MLLRPSRRRWRALIRSFSFASVAVSLLLLCFILFLYTLAPSPRSSRPHRLSHAVLRGAHLPREPKDRTRMPTRGDADAAVLVLGPFGDLMLSFLPNDLAFTIFIPTPAAFESLMEAIGGDEPSGNASDRDLGGGLRSNASYSLQEGKRDHALISRIFGFSTAPIRMVSSMIPSTGTMVEIESLSGFRLNLVRALPEGTLLVNNLVCSTVDISRGPIVIHLVEGVLMESEFERSVMPFKDDGESEDDLTDGDGK